MRISRILGALRRTPRHGQTSQRGGARSACNREPRRRDPQSGYAFLMALGLIIIMSLASLAILQRGATIRRRQVEQETIWRGNQYVRAIRLYYHKTGRYPQNLDDLTKGLPDLHFLRQAYKNPTNAADGSWRFIYINAAGQIIGSTRYATLQQMALMDANGGQLPSLQGQPGQPGVSVSSLGDSSGSSSSQPSQNPSTGTTTANPNNPTQGTSQQDNSGNPPPTQNPDATSGQNPSSSSPGQNNPPTGQGLPGAAGQAQVGNGVTQANLAAMALLKPTGPVDGPVLGGFLSGVACVRDASSQKVYHGGKKYIDWEFIWNPLEDAAAAMQQQMGNTAGGMPGQPATSSFGGGLGGNNPGQQNPTAPMQQPNPAPQQPQQPQ